MKATVVIPTYNRCARLAELLRCLETQGEALARVVVCDDGSSDDTAGVVRSFVGRLPVVYAHQENRGFRAGQARNMGIARAVGEVIIFVDDDVLVAPDFTAQHLAVHAGQTGGERPRVGVGYRNRAFDFPREQPTWEDIVRAEPDDRIAELGADGHGLHGHETPWFFIYSCNFSISQGRSWGPPPQGSPRGDRMLPRAFLASTTPSWAGGWRTSSSATASTAPATTSCRRLGRASSTSRTRGRATRSAARCAASSPRTTAT